MAMVEEYKAVMNDKRREEIREGIAKHLYYLLTIPYRNEDNVNETKWEAIPEKDREYYRDYYADPFLKKLDSYDVVIKVKRELPAIPLDDDKPSEIMNELLLSR